MKTKIIKKIKNFTIREITDKYYRDSRGEGRNYLVDRADYRQQTRLEIFLTLEEAINFCKEN